MRPEIFAGFGGGPPEQRLPSPRTWGPRPSPGTAIALACRSSLAKQAPSCAGSGGEGGPWRRAARPPVSGLPKAPSQRRLLLLARESRLRVVYGLSAMLFTSYKYALFVVLAFCVYYVAARLSSRAAASEPGAARPELRRSTRIWDWRWCVLLAGVMASGFLGGLLLERMRESAAGWSCLAVLLIDLGALGLFKYYRLLRRLVRRSAGGLRPARRLGDALCRPADRHQLLRVPEPLLCDRRLPPRLAGHARLRRVRRRPELLPAAARRPHHAAPRPAAAALRSVAASTTPALETACVRCSGA